MNPPSNTGSFGNGQASPELLAAIQRRQTPGGPTNAVMTSAPGFDPTQQPVSPTPASSASVGSPPSPQSVGVGLPNPSGGTGTGLPMNTPESELIVKALDSRLKSLSKIQGA